MGTRFRITVNEEGKKSSVPYSPVQSLKQLGKIAQKNTGDRVVRVETYEGKVRFSKGSSSVDVQSGLFSETRTQKDGVDVGRLPRTPNILSPLKGGFLQTPPLMWTSQRKCSYVVELAQMRLSIGYRRRDCLTQISLIFCREDFGFGGLLVSQRESIPIGLRFMDLNCLNRAYN